MYHIRVILHRQHQSDKLQEPAIILVNLSVIIYSILRKSFARASALYRFFLKLPSSLLYETYYYLSLKVWNY